MEEQLEINESVTMELILSVFKNFSDRKSMKEIKAAVVSLLTPSDKLICENQLEIEQTVEQLIKEDKKLDKESFLNYTNGKYKKRSNKPQIQEPLPIPIPPEYIGIAGECAVMSELMFHGYNANRMMIDEGVDIVAVKNNIYYYIQVKTTVVKNGRIYCQIGNDRFNQYFGAPIRYFVVARYNEKGIDKNIFFMFTSQEIDKARYAQCIKQGETSISIKIRFHEKTGEPILYMIQKK